MAEDARRNAEQRKAWLLGRVKQLDDDRASVEKQLAEVDSFLKAMDVYSTLDPRAPVAPVVSSTPTSPRKRPQNPPREKVLESVADALERSARPMQLRELFEAVTASGIDLQGTDPQAVLGTMIWRARKRFANIKGYGYWFADRPYAQADYRPEGT